MHGINNNIIKFWEVILCLWFRASLIYINNCPTRCNTKQSIYYSASSLYMFSGANHPSSGVHKTVTTASGTGHIFCATTALQRGQAWPRWREVVAGCGWHSKHVEWTCRVINRLLCVVSRWTVINIYRRSQLFYYHHHTWSHCTYVIVDIVIRRSTTMQALGFTSSVKQLHWQQWNEMCLIKQHK